MNDELDTLRPQGWNDRQELHRVLGELSLAQKTLRGGGDPQSLVAQIRENLADYLADTYWDQLLEPPDSE